MKTRMKTNLCDFSSYKDIKNDTAEYIFSYKIRFGGEFFEYGK